MCQPHLDYQKINPNTQLMIIAECNQGCIDTVIINYEFSIFKEWEVITNDPQKKWVECIPNATGV